MALVLEHGLRADRPAAEALVARSKLQRSTLADYQQRIEALRMYGWPLAGVGVSVLCRSVRALLPRLAYLAAHAYAPPCIASRSLLVSCRRRVGDVELYSC